MLQINHFSGIRENIAQLTSSLASEAVAVFVAITEAEKRLNVDSFVKAAVSLSKMASNKSSKTIQEFIEKCRLAKTSGLVRQ